jgi:hypothetical protein
VALRETNRGEWIRLYNWPAFNNKAAFRRGDSFEGHDMAGFQMHFLPNLCWNRNLAAFGNCRSHMIKYHANREQAKPDRRVDEPKVQFEEPVHVTVEADLTMSQPKKAKGLFTTPIYQISLREPSSVLPPK